MTDLSGVTLRYPIGSLVRTAARTYRVQGGHGTGLRGVVVGYRPRAWDRYQRPYEVRLEGCPRRVYKFAEGELEVEA